MRTPRALLAAVAGAAALMLLVWFMFLYRPQGNEISDLQTELETAQAEEQSLAATLEQLEAIDADRPALEAELRRLTAAVPPRPELASFILAAHDMAAEAGIDFMSITPSPPGPIDGRADLAVIAMGISAEGPFFSVLDFLDRLEDLERVVVVDSLNLTRVAPTPPTTTTTQAAAAFTTAFTANGVPIVVQGMGDPNLGGGVTATGGGAPGVQPGLLSGSIGAALRGQVVGEHTVTVDIQARAFTTAVPATATTTTTAPANGATTTTAAG
ncbi:MAG TPA: type 4a pilus biogenesis protein PilO [Acidimicrobiia bacterium]|nr:type 4a pilus biogenesis protein PilO [Acidimicrobiia bacterium]